MKPDLSRVDFALDELPGSELHQVLDGYRDEASVAPTRFLGLPAWVITGHAVLLEACQRTSELSPLPRKW